MQDSGNSVVRLLVPTAPSYGTVTVTSLAAAGSIQTLAGGSSGSNDGAAGLGRVIVTRPARNCHDACRRGLCEFVHVVLVHSDVTIGDDVVRGTFPFSAPSSRIHICSRSI